MGVVTSGSVNITVRVDGVGQAPKKVDEASSSLTKLDKAGAQASSSVSTLRDRMGALKSAAGPVNVIRETFENLRSNLGLVTLAFTGLVSVAGALFDALDVAPRVDSTTEAFFRLAGSVSSATSELGGLVQKAAEMRGALAAVDTDIAEMDAQTAERLGNWEEATRLREEASRSRVENATKEIEAKLKEADDIANRAEVALRRQREEKRKNDEEINHLKLLIDMRREQGLATKLQEQQLLAVETAQGAVIVNLKLADTAYRDAASGVDAYSRKLQALDRNLEALQSPAAQRPKAPGDTSGGGVQQPRESPADRLRRAFIEGDQEAIDKALSRDGGIRLSPANDNGSLSDTDTQQIDALAKTREQIDSYIKETERLRGSHALGDPIRDFAGALSEAIPSMGSFGAALGEVSRLWSDYADTGKDAARASILSVGAIARAGAEQIKNERLRAGVLSVIELGLGTGLLFVPGRQAEAASHLAAAGILAGVAIFGSGSGSSGGGRSRGAGGGSRVSRPLGDTMTGGGWSINIFGGWFGTSHPAETAAALHALARRGAGSGFVPLPRAA